MDTNPKSLINPKYSCYLLSITGNHISPSAAIPNMCLSPQVVFCKLSNLRSLLVFSLCHCYSLPFVFNLQLRTKLPQASSPNCLSLLYGAAVWHRLEYKREISWFSFMRSILQHAASDRAFQPIEQTCSLCLMFYKYDKLSGISTATDQSELRGRRVGWVIGIKSKQCDWMYPKRLYVFSVCKQE